MEMPEDGVWWLNYSQYEDLRLYEVGIQRCAPYAIWGMAWLELPMKVVVSCDKLGRGAYIFGTQDCLMGLPSTFFLC